MLNPLGAVSLVLGSSCGGLLLVNVGSLLSDPLLQFPMKILEEGLGAFNLLLLVLFSSGFCDPVGVVQFFPGVNQLGK